MTDIHDAPYEFKLLVSMHHHGLLKLHVHDCSNSFFILEPKPVADTLLGGILNFFKKKKTQNLNGRQGT